MVVVHTLLVNDIQAYILETDAAFPTEARRQAEDILVKNGAQYYFQIFSGASHGFGARGDPADDAQRASTLFLHIHPLITSRLLLYRLCERGMCARILALVQQVRSVVTHLNSKEGMLSSSLKCKIAMLLTVTRSVRTRCIQLYTVIIITNGSILQSFI